MICILNRKELLTTADMERQTKIRNILSENNIPYQVRVRSNTGGLSRSRTVLPGTNPARMYQYYIYVKRSDYEKAKFFTK